GPVHPVGEGVQDGKAAAGPDLESGAIEPGAAVNRRAIEIAIGPLNHTGVWVKGTGAAAEKARDGYEGPRGVGGKYGQRRARAGQHVQGVADDDGIRPGVRNGD